LTPRLRDALPGAPWWSWGRTPSCSRPARLPPPPQGAVVELGSQTELLTPRPPALPPPHRAAVELGSHAELLTPRPPALPPPQGAVVELGSHAELLKDPTGHYSTLVKLQLQVGGYGQGGGGKGRAEQAAAAGGAWGRPLLHPGQAAAGGGGFGGGEDRKKWTARQRGARTALQLLPRASSASEALVKMATVCSNRRPPVEPPVKPLRRPRSRRRSWRRRWRSCRRRAPP
jgi:hypothetical protein